VVSTTPRSLYPRERPGTHCTGCWVGHRAGLDVCEKSRPYRDSIPGTSSFLNTNTEITRQLMRTARTLEAEGRQVLRESKGAKEDESITGLVRTTGFHHGTASFRLAGVLKLTKRLLLNFPLLSSRGEPWVTETVDLKSVDTGHDRIFQWKARIKYFIIFGMCYCKEIHT
jgi:hypothetical protein